MFIFSLPKSYRGNQSIDKWNVHNYPHKKNVKYHRPKEKYRRHEHSLFPLLGQLQFCQGLFCFGDIQRLVGIKSIF